MRTIDTLEMGRCEAATPGGQGCPAQDRVRTGAGALPARRSGAEDVWLYDPWCFSPWYTAALARGLLSAGTAVRLVCPRYHFEPEYFTHCRLDPRPGVLDVAAGLQLRAPALRVALRSAEYAINTVALGVDLVRRRPMIMHLQLCPLLARGISVDLQLAGWARRRGVRLVHTVHNLLPHDTAHDRDGLHRRLYRICDRLICHNADTATRLEREFNISPERIDVIPHGPLFAEPPELTPDEARQRLGLDLGRPVFLWQGILAPYKGIDLLLDAWAEVARSLPAQVRSPCLLIAGRGSKEDTRAIRNRVEQLEAPVKLHMEYIPATELPCYYQAADFLLYPYREITTSGALMTGLNYRKPIVASDLPAFRAVVEDGVNGLLFPNTSAADLARAILRLLTEPTLVAALRLGAAGNQDRQVQWSGIARSTQQTYRKAVDQASQCLGSVCSPA
jgi:glycosyltransferase involved in cell wall biosynthesis